MPPRVVIFKGKKYRLSGKYYRRDAWGTFGPSNLHRAIWEDAYGPIPAGTHVHHRDGNTLNNDLANLELIGATEHLRLHTLDLIARGILQPPSAEALARAAEWHRSPEGHVWHKAHGKDSWVDREQHAKTCQQCGRPYTTSYPNRSKWCSANCRARARRHDRADNESRICIMCRTAFQTNRYKPTVTCSKGCANRLLSRTKRGL